MENFPFWFLIAIFIISALITYLAGITLTKTTTTLDSRFRLGDALGGLVLLGISGSLPEIAISISAAAHGHLDVIIGTLLGGIAFQTLIIVFLDFAVKGKKPLAYLAGSPMLVIEILFAIAITVLAILGIFVPAQKSIFNINPFSLIVVAAWIGGLFFINRLRQSRRYLETKPAASSGRSHKERRAFDHPTHVGKKTGKVVLVFLLASLATLIAGYFVEETGTLLAAKIGMGSGLFAATFIALVSSLPEISTGLESIFLGDNCLAVSDIIGGNAFMLTIFLFSDLVAKKPILSFAGTSDIFFGILGIILMAIYAFSFWRKPRRRYLRLGIDSIMEILIYILGLLLIINFLR